MTTDLQRGLDVLVDPQLLEEGRKVVLVAADLQHLAGHAGHQVAAEVPERGPVRLTVDEWAKGVGNFGARVRARHVQARHQVLVQTVRGCYGSRDRVLGDHVEEDRGGGLEELGSVPTLRVELLVGLLYPRDYFDG